MDLYSEYLNKPCKIVYKEDTEDSIAKVSFVKLIGYDDTHIKVEFLRDKNTKVIQKVLMQSIITTEKLPKPNPDLIEKKLSDDNIFVPGEKA